MFSGSSLWNGEKLTSFKISADTFAGVYITEQIEKQNRYNVVQLIGAVEVSFVSQGCGSDKPENEINQLAPL